MGSLRSMAHDGGTRTHCGRKAANRYRCMCQTGKVRTSFLLRTPPPPSAALCHSHSRICNTHTHSAGRASSVPMQHTAGGHVEAGAEVTWYGCRGIFTVVPVSGSSRSNCSWDIFLQVGRHRDQRRQQATIPQTATRGKTVHGASLDRPHDDKHGIAARGRSGLNGHVLAQLHGGVRVHTRSPKLLYVRQGSVHNTVYSTHHRTRKHRRDAWRRWGTPKSLGGGGRVRTPHPLHNRTRVYTLLQDQNRASRVQ